MTFNSFQAYANEFYTQSTSWAKAAVIGGVIIALYIPYKYCIIRKRKTPIKNDYKEGMVYLYQFPRVKFAPNLSPFCLKLETWLRMADIQYENVCSWSIRSLEGTLPFLEYNGKEYPDSALAIRDMTAIFNKESMENYLNEEQKASVRAFEALAENSLVMTVAYFRVKEHLDEYVRSIPDQAFGMLTPIWKFFLKIAFSSKGNKRMKIIAVGKHNRDEIIYISNEDLKAISAYLGSELISLIFFPVDATLFGVLAQIVYAPSDLPQKKIIETELPNLKEYCDRIKGRYWPDWDKCIKEFSEDSNWKRKTNEISGKDKVPVKQS